MATIPVGQDRPEIDFATLDLLPYGIIVVDPAGVILYYNAREEQIAGRQRDDVVGRNFFSDVAPCTQVQEFHGRFEGVLQHTGGVASFNFRFPFPDRPRHVEITLASFQNKGERLCLISVRDVTEQDEVRALILRAERFAEAGEVAAGVAHNFNNLLGVIRGNAELLERALPAEHPARVKLERITKATSDGAEMVRRVTDGLRHERREPIAGSEVDLNGVVADAIAFSEEHARSALLARGARIGFDPDLASERLVVSGSASELREVFVNLLRNAIDAIADEGRIRVGTRKHDGWCVADVSDSGEGMSDEILRKLFRPLFTTKGANGTGLGLATCYAIARRHGGDITVRSAPGLGTTFTLRLPPGH